MFSSLNALFYVGDRELQASPIVAGRMKQGQKRRFPSGMTNKADFLRKWQSRKQEQGQTQIPFGSDKQGRFAAGMVTK